MNHMAIVKNGIVALTGVGFFLAIMGVFGFSASIASLLISH
jgi:hypothetical protein